YQQRLINTWLKHSEPPLIFNLAVKRNAFTNRRTIGNEYLSDIHDYRTHDLEKYLSTEFEIFAAEVLFLQLSLAQLLDSPVNETVLRDSNQLKIRRSSEYAMLMRDGAEFLFPDLSYKDIAAKVFADPALTK